MTDTPQIRPKCDEILIAIRRIIQSVEQHSKYLMKEFGLSGPQLIILREVSLGNAKSASELARAVCLSQATVAGILVRLEKRALISRRRSHRDLRRILVKVTSAGRGLLEKAPPLMQESFTEKLNGLQWWEQQLILRSLQKIAIMMDTDKIPVAPVLAPKRIGPNADSESTLSRNNNNL